ncbi:MAG: hypothetical protein WD512_14715, partial [Candidatus Paceibacterota bacterium]
SWLCKLNPRLACSSVDTRVYSITLSFLITIYISLLALQHGSLQPFLRNHIFALPQLSSNVGFLNYCLKFLENHVMMSFG